MWRNKYPTNQTYNGQINLYKEYNQASSRVTLVEVNTLYWSKNDAYPLQYPMGTCGLWPFCPQLLQQCCCQQQQMANNSGNIIINMYATKCSCAEIIIKQLSSIYISWHLRCYYVSKRINSLFFGLITTWLEVLISKYVLISIRV